MPPGMIWVSNIVSVAPLSTISPISVAREEGERPGPAVAKRNPLSKPSSYLVKSSLAVSFLDSGLVDAGEQCVQWEHAVDTFPGALVFSGRLAPCA